MKGSTQGKNEILVYKSRHPRGNPIANALVVIVGALAIGASSCSGFFAFVVLGSIVLVLGAIIALRVWWFNRKLQKQSGAGSRRQSSRRAA